MSPMLSTFGAASARTFGFGSSGGEQGYVLTVDPDNASGQTQFYTGYIDGSGTMYPAGLVQITHNSAQAKAALICKGSVDGTISLARSIVEGSGSSITYQVRSLYPFSSGSGLLAGLTLYSSNRGEGAAAVDVNSSTLVWDDLDSGQSGLRGFRNNNYRSGKGMICQPDGTDVYMATHGWTGSNVGNYQMKYASNYGPNPTYFENWTFYSQMQYTRAIQRDGSVIYAGALGGFDIGNGGYSKLIAKFTASTGAGDIYGESKSTSGGAYGPQQSQIADSDGCIFLDSSHIYVIGNNALNGSAESQKSYMHIMKLAKSNLALQWERKIQTKSGSTRYNIDGQAVAVDSSGNVYGVSGQSGPETNRVLFVKYNSSGTLQWLKEFGRTNTSHQTRVQKLLVYGDFLYGFGRTNLGSDHLGMVTKFPLDGPVAGTYGDYIVVDKSSSNYNEDTSYPSYSTTTFNTSGATASADAQSVDQANQSLTVTKTDV